jgi:uncharacterized protein (DUF302 family)
MKISRFTIEHIYLTSAKPFDDVRANLERQLGRFDPEAQTALAADENPDSVKAKIEAMAGLNGLMLFATYDHGAILKIVGHTRKALQYVVGNPLFAAQMTRHAIGASLYAPLRMLLHEIDQAETCLEYDRPSSLFGQFNDDRVAQVAESLERKLEELAATAMR